MLFAFELLGVCPREYGRDPNNAFAQGFYLISTNDTQVCFCTCDPVIRPVPWTVHAYLFICLITTSLSTVLPQRKRLLSIVAATPGQRRNYASFVLVTPILLYRVSRYVCNSLLLHPSFQRRRISFQRHGNAQTCEVWTAWHLHVLVVRKQLATGSFLRLVGVTALLPVSTRVLRYHQPTKRHALSPLVVLRPGFAENCKVDISAPANDTKFNYAIFPFQSYPHQVTWQCIYSGFGCVNYRLDVFSPNGCPIMHHNSHFFLFTFRETTVDRSFIFAVCSRVGFRANTRIQPNPTYAFCASFENFFIIMLPVF